MIDDELAWVPQVYEFEYAGLRTGDVEVTAPTPGVARATGTICAGEETVGRFAAMVFRTQRGAMRAMLQVVAVDPRYQGHGFATSFTNHLEREYAAAGVATLDISLSEIGAYVSARRLRGLSFAADARRQVLGIWEHHGEEALAEAQEKGGMPAEEAATIRALFDDVRAGTATPPAPYELAELGDAHPWQDDSWRMWFGKRMLIGTHWSGTKRLQTAAEPGAR